MIIYTLGYTKKSAQQFFDLIAKNDISLLIDVRLHNKSQLAGFSKGTDLSYFLNKLCGCGYEHDITFAPTDAILKEYRNKNITWDLYQERYIELISNRNCEIEFQKLVLAGNHNKVCLLCSEPSARFCHRRLLAEYLAGKLRDIKIMHI